MELILALWMFVAGLTVSHSLPVQSNQDSVDENINFINENETAFGQILTANKAIINQLLEGDIVPHPSRSALSCTSCFWPASSNGSVVIPYEISTDYSDSEKKLFSSAMQQMELLTCIMFIKRNEEEDYLYIFSGTGCWSGIGKSGGKHSVSLSKSGCLSFGTTQHEIMHALGFFHEQGRSDRDTYVDVIWQYIKEQNKGNFKKMNTNNLDLPYDYSSVMHYPTYAFSTTAGKLTLIPKPDSTVPIGQRSGMSHLDVKKVNKLYKCNVCRTKLTASSGSFSSDGIRFGADESCIWFIQGASNKKVYLNFTIQNLPSSSGCSENYIQIYDGPNKGAKLFMDKLCGSVTLPPLISTNVEIIVEFVSKKDPALSKFSGVYKTVTHGGTFYSDRGYIKSPLYPIAYENNMDAVYSIIAPVQSKLMLQMTRCVINTLHHIFYTATSMGHQKVSLNFTNFYIQYCKFTCSCVCDYVWVIDGPSLSSPSLGKFCGFKKPPTLVSTTNVMLVGFHSDDKLIGMGFSATYKFV